MSHSNLTSLQDTGTEPVHTIHIHGIPETLLQRLDERVRASGSDRSRVIQDILTKELGSEKTELSGSDFDAALAPIRQGFAESGLNEEEAVALLEEGLRAVRQDRRLGGPPQGSTAQADAAQVR